MPLSTSNSNADSWPETYWKRPIPNAHWQGVSLLTLILVLGFLISWETYWRSQGYEPSYEETNDLWAANRSRVTDDPNQLVLIGSSRTSFDIDLDMWEQDWQGRRPIMLARPGTGPRGYLTDLANDPTFKGTVICGVTPLLFFAPDFLPPVQFAYQNVDYFQTWSPSQKSGYLLSIPIESAFASINREDLTLKNILHKKLLPIKNRMSPMLPPPLPPYFGRIDKERRYHMWARAERDPNLQQTIQQIWIPLFKFMPTLEGEGLDALLAKTKEEVAQIQSRGGQVVFLNLPNDGQLTQIENERWPREVYWDRLLNETGAPGINFQDHKELNTFNCPEWSHLTRSDAVLFTHRLAPILKGLID